MFTHLRRLSCLLLLCTPLAATPGCSQDPEHAAVLDALAATVQAIESRDWRQVWDLSAPAAREELIALHGELTRAVAAVDQVYPTAERARARAAVGEPLVEDIPIGAVDAGPRIVARLLAPDAVRLDDKARAGLQARGAVIDDDRAVIHTSAGETFTFRKDHSGRWRSRLVMDILDQSREVQVLRENAAALVEAARERREAWQASRDARQPQGAYNLTRAALERRPYDAATLFALLDGPAREALVEALRTARDAQKAIQRRTTRKHRPAAYAMHGIALHVAVDSDRALFVAWTESDGFSPPLADDSPPARVEETSDGAAVVLTESGQRVPVSRDADGMWHLAAMVAPIRASLVAPAAAALEAVTAP